MKDSGILTTRYANVLYNLALDEKIAKTTYRSMLKIMSALNSADGQHIKKMATSTNVQKSIKLEIWEAIFGTLDTPALLKNFIRILINNQRINLYEKVVREYAKILLKRSGTKEVTLTTPIKLKKTDLADVTDLLEEAFAQKISLSTTVDTSLLGGVILTFDSYMLDLSMQHKLDRIKTLLLK